MQDTGLGLPDQAVPCSRWYPAATGCSRHLLGLVILELNVQAILNPHLHLNRGVELWVGAQSVHNYVHLLHHIVQSAADSRSEEIPAGRIPLLLGPYRQQQRRSREGHRAEWIALPTKPVPRLLRQPITHAGKDGQEFSNGKADSSTTSLGFHSFVSLSYLSTIWGI